MLLKILFVQRLVSFFYLLQFSPSLLNKLILHFLYFPNLSILKKWFSFNIIKYFLTVFPRLLSLINSNLYFFNPILKVILFSFIAITRFTCFFIHSDLTFIFIFLIFKLSSTSLILLLFILYVILTLYADLYIPSISLHHSFFNLFENLLYSQIIVSHYLLIIVFAINDTVIFMLYF